MSKPTEQELPDDFSWLLDLSFQLGEDLTIQGDLSQRLDAAVLMAKGCQQELVVFVDAVRAYEVTIQGHTPVPQVWLDDWMTDNKDDLTDAQETPA